MSRLLRAVLLAGLVLPSLGGQSYASDDVLSPSKLPDREALAARLWSHSPEVLGARMRTDFAEAEADRATRWPNPVLDAGWNTLPLGETNPPNLSQPISNVPNYQVGLSTAIELGKRGPRKAASRGGRDAARLDAHETLRQVYLDLFVTLGHVATAQERLAALSEEVADAARLTLLVHERATHGDLARLDEERSRLEEAKLRALLSDGQHQLSEALLDCGRIAGATCLPFDTTADAIAFLSTYSDPPPIDEAKQALSHRPDLRSLTAQESGALAAGQLAKAKRLPDPTVRLGYTRDQFVVSGNQKHSVSVALAIPLPFSERGQADAAIANATARTAHELRELRQAQAVRDLDRLAAQYQALRERQRIMRGEYLPLAQSVVARLTATVKAGGAPLADLLVARRSLNELLTDASDVDRSVFEASLAISRISGARAPSPPATQDLPAQAP